MVDSALNDATLKPATEISTEPDAEALAEPDADTEPEVDNATDPGTTTIDEVTPGPNLGDIAEQEDNPIDDVNETTRNNYETNTNDNEAKVFSPPDKFQIFFHDFFGGRTVNTTPSSNGARELTSSSSASPPSVII